MLTENAVNNSVYTDPCLEEQHFTSDEAPGTISATSDVDASSIFAASENNTASSASITASTTPDLDNPTLFALHAERCFGKNAIVGTTAPSRLQKSAAQLSREEEKRVKLQRREMASKTKEARRWKAEQGLAPTVHGVRSGSQKRTRSDDDRAEGNEMKRNLTDAVAAEIAQQRDHTFSDGLDQNASRRGSVIGVDTQDFANGAVGKVQEGGPADEQHLAPPSTGTTTNAVAPNLEITDDDDEMTRMLKEELAKPHPEMHDDDEPEDPRVEVALQPLMHPEKLYIAQMLSDRGQQGKGLPTLEKLRMAVDQMIHARGTSAHRTMVLGERAKAARKPTSEVQEIERRPKLVPKSRKGAPRDAHGEVAAGAPPSSVRLSLPPCYVHAGSGDPAAPPAASHTAPATVPARSDYATRTKAGLSALCRKRGLAFFGTKTALLRRLTDYDEAVAKGKSPQAAKAATVRTKKNVPMWTK